MPCGCYISILILLEFSLLARIFDLNILLDFQLKILKNFNIFKKIQKISKNKKITLVKMIRRMKYKIYKLNIVYCMKIFIFAISDNIKLVIKEKEYQREER